MDVEDEEWDAWEEDPAQHDPEQVLWRGDVGDILLCLGFEHVEYN